MAFVVHLLAFAPMPTRQSTMATSEDGPLPTIERPEPTLATAFRSLAAAQHSARFYQVLELGIPAAVQLGVWGMWRAAGWSSAVAAFGAWALFEKRVKANARAIGLPASQLHPARWIKAGRFVAGLIGAALAAGLTLELFVRLVNPILRCLGCAG